LGQTTVVQALHLMNSPNLERKISEEKGRAKALADAITTGKKQPDQVVRELYLRAYGRPPLPAETEKCLSQLDSLTKKGLKNREWVEDMMWALLNSPEFVFKD
jgi:hypothetical protein